jgi:PAS domain S-box-containing protein
VEFAIEQVLRNDTLDALPAVLARLVTAFSGRCALAFQPRTGQPPVVLAAHPDSAAADEVLLSRVGALNPAPGGAADSGSLLVPLKSGGPGGSALLAYSAPAGGQCLCALALVGHAMDWDTETLSVLNAVATAVAVQIRHANNVAGLADREALAQTLIAGSPNSVIATDSRRRVVVFNPAAEKLSGYRRDDVLGQEMAGLLIPERERAAFVAQTEQYLATGDRGEYSGPVRVPLLRADGTERIVELTARHLTQDGETFFCGFFRDLTDFEHAQTALAESRARFSLLAQLAPVGIMQSDVRGRAIFVNDRWCAIAGVRPKDALGTDWLDLVHPDDRDRVARDLASAASKGEMRTECRLRSSDGGGIWVQASAVALQAAGDAPSGFLATLTDISDVKRAAAEPERLLAKEKAARIGLADQTERLNCLIANAIPGVLVTDERGRITHLNQSFAIRSAIRAAPPDRAVSDSRNSGTHPITSRICSPMSTRGSMAATRLRRSTSDGGSAIALSLVTWIRPASSTRTSALAASRPATYFSASSSAVTWEASSAPGSSGRPSVVASKRPDRYIAFSGLCSATQI